MQISRILPLVDRNGGIGTRAQLRERGATGPQLSALVRSGRLIRVRRGWYASPLATDAQRTAVRIGGILAGPSAAASYGLWAGFGSAVHVGLPGNAGRLRTRERLDHSGGEVHPDRGGRSAVLHWGESGQDQYRRARWRASVDVAVAQTLEWSDAETAIACADSALSLRLTDLDRLAAALATREASAVAWARLRRVRPGSGSGLESVVRQRLERVGIAVVQQVAIAGVGDVDMVIAGRLVVELDGREHHESWEAAERDRRRDALLVAQGYRVLRFTYGQVFGDWDFVIGCIRAALAHLG